MSHARPKMIPVPGTNVEIAELKRLQRRVERLFSALEEALELETAERFSAFSPPVDLYETDDSVLISIELPGVEADDINLVATAKDLTIEGVKKQSGATHKAVSHFCCERQFGKFRRRINLRWAININETSSELKNGSLKIRLPKLVDRRGKSVKIPVEDVE